MFQAVTHPAAHDSRALVRAGTFALLLQLALLAGALVLSRPRPSTPSGGPVVIFRPLKSLGGGASRPEAPRAEPKPSHPARSHPKARALRPPTPMPAPAVASPPTEAETGDEGAADDPGGHPGPSAQGPATGGSPGGGAGQLQVQPWGEGMTRPVALAGEPLHYSREALEARLEGTVLVKCVVTTEGRTERCEILKGIPLMNEEVLRSIRSHVYQPATFQGRPITVGYVFTVHLTMGR